MSTTPASADGFLPKVQNDIACFKERREILNSFDVTSLTDTQIQEFETKQCSWYPVYEHYGEKLYKESSVFFRVLSYIPNIPYFNINISGFETYTKLGEDAAKLDMKKFKVFLQEDIKNEISGLTNRILSDQQFLDDIMG